MKTGKKKTGAIIAIIVVLAILTAGALYAWTLFRQAIAEKQAVYNQAEAYCAAGNYRGAYRTYLQVEDFEDAGEKAAQVKQMMADAAKEHTAVAQHLSELKFNTVAGLYLTQILSDANRFTLDDYNNMAAMVGDFYALAEQQYQEVMTIDEKMTKTIMEELMPRIEALEQHKDPQEALLVMAEITTFSLADQVFLHCWQDGTFANTTLDTMAEISPLWVPVMDQVIAGSQDLDVMELVGRS